MSRAFTAVETLVAVALLVMLSAAIIGFLSDVQSQRERLAQLSEERLAGALVIGSVENASRSAVVRASGGAGFVGDATTLAIAHRTLALDQPEPSIDALHPERSFELAWDDERRVLSVNGDPVTPRVERLIIRYHDRGAWRDRFDSAEANRLPSAVEIAMWFGEPAAPPAEPLETANADEAAGVTSSGAFDERPAADEQRRAWGEPDRRRIIAIPRLRHDEQEDR